MKTKFIWFAVIALFCPLFTGCKVTEYTEENTIVAVWKHGVNSYSVTTREGEVLKDKSFPSTSSTSSSERFKLITDVPVDQPMWYKAHYRWDGWNLGGYDNVEIHIHGVKDINGAGWNHGKSGSGMLEKVD